METAGHDPLERLERAVEAWLDFSAGGGVDTDAFLAAQDPELLPLLEPIVRGAPPEPQAPRQRPRIAGFRIVREIGRGGMGTVFEAVDEKLERRTALKILGGHLALSERGLERFRREAAAAARLRHPGIAQVYGSGQEDGTHWIAMELVDGSSLDELIRAGVGEPGERTRLAAELAAQVAEALEFAHKSDVVHRDIKPHNILVDGEGHARLIDFGIAKLLDREQLSVTGDFAGSLGYASPEQLAGKREIDARTDVWSLGVVLYEMLESRRPFDAPTQEALVRAILTREPEALRVARDLATICLKALEKEAPRRYESAGAMAVDLRSFLRGDPIEASRPGAISRFTRFARRRRTGVLATVAATAALGIGIAWFVDRLDKDQLVDDLVDRAGGALARLEKMIDDNKDLSTSEAVARRRQRIETHVGEAERLLALRPEDVRLRRRTAIAHQRAAHLYQCLKLQQPALEAYGRVLELHGGATPDVTRVPEDRETVATALHDRHILLRAVGKNDQADEDLADAIALWERVVEQVPRLRLADVSRGKLAIAFTNRARRSLGSAESRRDLERADRLWTELEERKKLTASQFAHWIDARTLRGESQYVRGKIDDARQTIDALLQRVEAMPERVRARRDVSTHVAEAHFIRARASIANGDVATARASFDASHRICRTLAKSDVGSDLAKLASAEIQLAEFLLEATKDFDAVEGLLDSCEERCAALLAKTTTFVDVRSFHARVASARADWLVQTKGESKEIEAAFRTAIARHRRRVEDGSGTVQELAGTEGMFASWLSRCRRNEESLAICKRTIGVFEKLIDRGNTHPRVVRNYRAHARLCLAGADRLKRSAELLVLAKRIKSKLPTDRFTHVLALLALDASVLRRKGTKRERNRYARGLVKLAIDWIRAMDRAGVVWRNHPQIKLIRVLKLHPDVRRLLAAAEVKKG